MQKLLHFGSVFFCLMLMSISALGQSVVTGTVTDSQGEALIGVNIQLKGTITGTVTNSDGAFSFETKRALPLTFVFSYIGYAKQEVEITSADPVTIEMQEQIGLGQEVVVSASRIQESILRSSVSIQQMDAIAIQENPAPDMYGAIANMKGVQMNTSSITFTSVNTRGFADVQNWRFIQLNDGMEVNAPGLNYPVGGTTTTSELDIESIELVPGAGSALYGPNAFNGVLVVRSKSPFTSRGLGVYAKSGTTVQDAAGVNPFYDVGFRFAHVINDKLAFKINLSYLRAQEWHANDDSPFVSNTVAAGGQEAIDAVLAQTRANNPTNYNAVNVYGDEVVASVDLLGDGVMVGINRSGIHEADIVDYDTESFKVQGALHYRITDNLEASYDVRLSKGDAILRHTTVYPLENFTQQLHKIELNSSNFNLRGYYSKEDAGDSYAMLTTAAFIEGGLKSNAAWATDYAAAYQGLAAGVTAADHNAARAYADRDIPGPDSEQFQTLLKATLDNSDLSTGGSKFIDRTSLTHVEAEYNLADLVPFMGLQIGGTFRQFNLDSEGQLFNDGPLGFGEAIPINEYGAYMQASKELMDESLKFTASVRYDKNQNFDGGITPRGSMVFSFGENREHNLRLSGQTGFRNPGTQESYIALDVGAAVLLGGTQDNVENYSYDTGAGIVDGQQIYDNLYTIGSFLAFAGSGFTDASLLVEQNLAYIKQEKISTYEIGYKGVLGGSLLLDINYYNNTYNDFVTRVTTFSLDVGRAFAVYTNIEDEITSYGAGFNIEYAASSGYRFGGNYSFAKFDADDAVANNPGFLPSFNTPENRFNLSISNRDVMNGLGFSIKYRWSDEYDWVSPFGHGHIESYSVIDAAVMYKLTGLGADLKVGAANLLNQEYQQVYGGPQVGSQFYFSIQFNDLLK